MTSVQAMFGFGSPCHIMSVWLRVGVRARVRGPAPPLPDLVGPVELAKPAGTPRPITTQPPWPAESHCAGLDGTSAQTGQVGEPNVAKPCSPAGRAGRARRANRANGAEPGQAG